MFDSAEILTGQNFASKCDHVFAQMVDVGGSPRTAFNSFPQQLKPGELIFCKTDYILQLFLAIQQIHDNTVPFTIVTHDSDYCITEEMVNFIQDRPIKWWGINCETQKANSIPLGIANSYCGITMKSKDFIKSQSPTKLLYLNHRIETHPVSRAWLYDHFSGKDWCTIRNPYPKGEIAAYRDELLDHKFIICPRGNGIDTHRMWEALYCGVIPVVMRHRTHSNLEGNLPILFVDDYREINEKILNNFYTNSKEKSWNYDMLNVSWWINEMRKQHAN